MSGNISSWLHPCRSQRSSQGSWSVWGEKSLKEGLSYTGGKLSVLCSEEVPLPWPSGNSLCQTAPQAQDLMQPGWVGSSLVEVDCGVLTSLKCRAMGESEQGWIWWDRGLEEGGILTLVLTFYYCRNTCIFWRSLPHFSPPFQWGQWSWGMCTWILGGRKSPLTHTQPLEPTLS